LITLVGLGQTTRANSFLTSARYLTGFTHELYDNIYKMSRLEPDFSYERDLWKRGYKWVGGVDEVGKGCLAGPVVAAVVVFTKDSRVDCYINDSKKLTQKQRERADEWIKNNCWAYGIGSVNSAQIDKFGIKKATEMAFRKAIVKCGARIDYLLVVAFYIPYVKGLRRKNQKPIKKGDQKSISIAAASIIAKVYRDGLMKRLSQNPKYKKYGWDANKGYGTARHLEAIKKFGKSRLHRVSFLLKLD
jgi:ribonuclease HII